MSDIGFNFDLVTLILVVVYLTWPGILIVGTAGVLLWSQHRVWGGLLGALIGCALWYAWFLYQYAGIRD